MAILKLHAHVPNLFELSSSIAAPIIVERGRQDVPDDVYLYCNMQYAIMHGGNAYTWFSNVWMYLNSKHGITVDKLHSRFRLSTLDLVSIIGHALIDDDIVNYDTLVYELCERTDETDAVTLCIDRLARRIHNKELRIRTLSSALSAPPTKQVRECLVSYGAMMSEAAVDYPLYAACCGDVDVVKVLNDVPFMKHHGVLYNAAASGELALVKTILKYIDEHADQYRKTKDMMGRIVATALKHNHLDICDLPQFSEYLHDPQLWYCVYSVDAARWLLNRHQAPVDVQRVLGSGRLDVLTYLVEEVNVPVPRDVLVNMLRFRSHYQDMGFINLLVRHGADVNAADDNGMTLLHYSPMYARYLLDNGANVLLTTKTGDTVLHSLVHQQHNMGVCDVGTVYRLLISSGADVNAKDDQGRTALDLVRQYGGHALGDDVPSHA